MAVFKYLNANIVYLHKTLPTFILPIMLVIIVILIGLIQHKKKIIYIAIGVLYIISTPIFSAYSADSEPVIPGNVRHFI